MMAQTSSRGPTPRPSPRSPCKHTLSSTSTSSTPVSRPVSPRRALAAVRAQLFCVLGASAVMGVVVFFVGMHRVSTGGLSRLPLLHSYRDSLWSLGRGDSGDHNDHAGFQLLVFLPLLGMKQGPRSASAVAERLAVQAWGLLATGAGRGAVVRVVGFVGQAADCDPWLDHVEAYECVELPARCGHPEYRGIPTVDCIFRTALDMARPGEVSGI
jgi:hypothetical protein